MTEMFGQNKERLDVFEVKIEKSEKVGSCWELNPGHLACAASALPLSYDNQTTTDPHNLQSTYTAY